MAKVKEIVKAGGRLVKMSSIRVELEDRGSGESSRWLEEMLIKPKRPPLISDQDRLVILKWMLASNTFENFLGRKFPDEKGPDCEMFVPAVKALLFQANKLSVSKFIFGVTSGSGAVNMLGSGLYVPVQPLLEAKLRRSGGSGWHPMDTFVVSTNEEFTNTSHSIVAGKAKAVQLDDRDFLGRQVWTLMVYTDDCLNGLGTAKEVLQLTRHPGFATMGTVHILVTDREKSKGWTRGLSCCNLARVASAPVVHVEAEDAYAVFYCMCTAALYRNTFQSDIFIDIERGKGCDAISTAMADTLDDLELKKPVMREFTKTLITDGLIKKSEVIDSIHKYQEWFEEQYRLAEQEVTSFSSWLKDKLATAANSIPWNRDISGEQPTPLTNFPFYDFARMLTLRNVPITVHKSVIKTLNKRLESIKEGKISWTMAETLAFAYLLKHDFNVRLSGKECNSNLQMERHYVLYDMISRKTYVPLNGLFPNNTQLTVVEAPVVAQNSVLGYELGVSQRSGKSLTIWEGSESNYSELQYTLDEFVSSSDGRWFKKSNLICLLPMDARSEHRSCRPERILQLCRSGGDSYNWSVTNVTTPANYFHLLAKQAFSSEPLVAFTSRTLASSISNTTEFLEGNTFKKYIADNSSSNKEEVVRVLVCSGRLYYDLVEAREARGLTQRIVISRIEQLWPFPYTELAMDVSNYRHASVHWVQEEACDRGLWSHVGPRISRALSNIKFEIGYIGPPSSYRKVGSLPDKISLMNQALDIF